MDIWTRVETALSTLGVPTAAGTFTGKPLPGVFIVFAARSDPAQAADDAETARKYLVHVSIFSNIGLLNLPNVDGAMLAAGFRKGAERMETYSMNDGYHHLIKDFTYLDPA